MTCPEWHWHAGAATDCSLSRLPGMNAKNSVRSDDLRKIPYSFVVRWNGWATERDVQPLPPRSIGGRKPHPATAPGRHLRRTPQIAPPTSITMLPHTPRNAHTRTQNRDATDAGENMNHNLLTRTPTPEADCQFLTQSPPPSHCARMWARVTSEFTAACEARMHRRVQGVKPCEARSHRSDGCTWMNVGATSGKYPPGAAPGMDTPHAPA